MKRFNLRNGLSLRKMEHQFYSIGNLECIDLPIESIDEVACSAMILRKDSNLYLKIVSEKTESCPCECDAPHTYYNKPIQLDDLKSTLDSLRFNRLINRFQPHRAEFDWTFLRSTTVKVNFDPCSVCRASTQSVTNCMHPLCWPCYDKIREFEGDTPCPICYQICSL